MLLFVFFTFRISFIKKNKNKNCPHNLNYYTTLRPGTLLKRDVFLCTGVFLWMCFTVKFAKFLRTPFLTEHLLWLLLIFGVEFVEIFFCYKPQIVRRKFDHAKEAVTQRCSVKKTFLEISQNSQENTCGIITKTFCLQYYQAIKLLWYCEENFQYFLSLIILNLQKYTSNR